MRAMVMAAGRGTRLAPLTDIVPKPAMPVGNEPVMGRILRLLAANGVSDVVSNIHYLADSMREVFGDGSAYGVRLQWSHEQQLLGTAGGVKNVEQFLRQGEEPILVLSGDGLHNFDLAALVRAHRDRGALATVALTPVDDPSQYGVAVLDDDGFIVGFQEKPSAAEAKSNLCNTGVYVFEPELFDRIPGGREYDFGHDLFPQLVAQERAIAGVVAEGYWNDIGGLDAYRLGNLAVAQGLLGDATPNQQGAADVLIADSAVIAGDATIIGPVVIGPDATVGSGARIAGSVVLPRAQVVDGALVAAAIYGSAEGLAAWAQQMSS